MSDNSNETTRQTLQKRVMCDYDVLQQQLMEMDKQIILIQIKRLSLSGVSIIFDNQELTSYEIVTAYKDKKIINVMVVGRTQSGKTGCMCSTIQKYLNDPSNLIPIENIYIITGLSSCEWKEQTKERMPESMQTRVFHRCELPSTFVDEIKDKKNVLIIMDEIQVAAKRHQTIYNAFNTAGLLDINKLYKNDIKILEFTATPDGTIYDLMKWKDASKIILGKPGEGYTSLFNLFQQERVKQFKNLCGIDIETELIKLDKLKNFNTLKDDSKIISSFITNKIKDDLLNNNDFDKTLFEEFLLTNNLIKYNEIFDIDKIEDMYNINKQIFKNIQEIKSDVNNYQFPLYHIIRTKPCDKQKLTEDHFKEIFGTDNYKFLKYDGESEIKDINEILNIKPKKHTFIFIKEMLRCAKTLKKKYNGIYYERYTTNPIDSTMIQGLGGRDTGYDNNGISIIYTNIESIIKYEELWESKFEDKTIKWNSNTTHYLNGDISGKKTFNDLEQYDETLPNMASLEREPIIKKFKTQEDAKKYYNDCLKSKLCGRGPNIKKMNNHGYYEATIRSNKKIYSCDEIKCERKQGITENSYRFYPCYEDINDKSTLQWWFIHY
jgi:hypothetical protein